MTTTTRRPTVLVCDDEPLVRLTVAHHLSEGGYEVLEAGDGEACLQVLQEHAPACVVLDLSMPRLDGLAVLRTLRQRGSETPVVVLTASGDVDNAIEATRLGAGAYLQKPADPREVELAVQRVLEKDSLRQQLHVLNQRTGYGDFIGSSDTLAPLFEALQQLESVSAPTVLILGESGTGKDVIARTIHARGPRQSKIFVDVDCTALPEHLVESELFGHEKGAFTDARATKRGLFEVANGGTVFLDEIGELPLPLQAKLLRALENRTFKRVGGLATLHLEAGVIAATNRDLEAEVAAGRFREDLFYRLNVITLKIPALRERREDIPLLASSFIGRFNKQFGCGIEEITGEAMELMMAYRWPGNVRELKNALERIAILGAPERLEAEHLPPEIRYARPLTGGPPQGGWVFELPEEGIVLAEVERGFVIQALERTGGNKTAAAELLGISRFQLRNRIQKFGLAAEPSGDG